MEPEPGSPAIVHVSCFMKKDEKCLVDRQSPLQAVDVVAELVSVSFLTLRGKPKEKTHYPHYRWLESFFNNKNLWSITISDMRGLSLMFNQLPPPPSPAPSTSPFRVRCYHVQVIYFPQSAHFFHFFHCSFCTICL